MPLAAKDPKQKILGVNNRVFLAVLFTTLAVIVECFLNYSGLLTWEYPWWSLKCPYLICLIGYLPFFTMAFVVHDMKKMKNKFIALGVIFGVDIILLVVFGSWVGCKESEAKAPPSGGAFVIYRVSKGTTVPLAGARGRSPRI